METTSTDAANARSPLAPKLPALSAVTRPFWEGCAIGEFRLQVCDECNHVTFYPRAICPGCFGSKLRWQKAAGHGVIVSHSTVHRGPGPEWQALCPYVVVVVKLAEGPTITSRLVEWQDSDLKIGQMVKVSFLATGTEVGIPLFHPVATA
jgi:uncharacterized protein